MERIRCDITLVFCSPKLLAAFIELCFEANSSSDKIHKSKTTWHIPPINVGTVQLFLRYCVEYSTAAEMLRMLFTVPLDDGHR